MPHRLWQGQLHISQPSDYIFYWQFRLIVLDLSEQFSIFQPDRTFYSVICDIFDLFLQVSAHITQFVCSNLTLTSIIFILVIPFHSFDPQTTFKSFSAPILSLVFPPYEIAPVH